MNSGSSRRVTALSFGALLALLGLVVACESNAPGAADVSVPGRDACLADCGVSACSPEEIEANCRNRVCGPDRCGGRCPPGCDEDHLCYAGGCIPAERDCSPEGRAARCAVRECGSDWCGGSCGVCLDCDGAENPDLCSAAGVCLTPCCPDCEGRECGDDGCGGSCGECHRSECAPSTGLCLPCEPDCEEDPCARDDGCGNRCESCPEGERCSMTGLCGHLMTCGEYHTCRFDCETGDFDCIEACDDLVSHAEFVAHGDYINCWIRWCAGVSSQAALNTCLDENCGAEYRACMSP